MISSFLSKSEPHGKGTEVAVLGSDTSLNDASSSLLLDLRGALVDEPKVENYFLL